MTKIQKLVDEIEDELCSAKSYAECYVDKKVKGNNQWATRFKEMSNDELKHANYLHELVVKEIEEIQDVVKPPQNMLDRWEEAHDGYVEKASWIKMMLTL